MSLDDTAITRCNLLRYDNCNNYSTPAGDYFQQEFCAKEYRNYWLTLAKGDTRNTTNKRLRLPSCALENDFDYNFHLKRLHHVIWRRWSIHVHRLQRLKVHPLDIDWDKDLDITVLYGPTISPPHGLPLEEFQNDSNNDTMSISSVDSDTFSTASSVSSCASSTTAAERKTFLRFNEFVLQREIDTQENCYEKHVTLNDSMYY